MSTLFRFSLLVILAIVVAACAAAPETTVVQDEPTAVVLPTETPSLRAADGTCTIAGPIKLGAIVSGSGAGEAFGTSIQQGIELAVEEINAQQFIAPEADLQVVFMDDGSNSRTASEAVTALIQEEQVVGIIGPTLSGAFFSAAPIAQAASVPMLGTSTTMDGIPNIGSYIFRSSLPDVNIIPNTVDTVRRELDVELVAMLYDSTDRSTTASYQVMRSTSRQQRLDIVAEEDFETGTEDFTSLLERIQAAEPDAVLLSATLQDAAAILIQAREMGLDMPFVGSDGFNSPALIELAGTAAEGVILPSAWFARTQSRENSLFVEAFEEKFNRMPDQFAAQAYTGAWLYAHAMKDSCSTIRSDVRNAMAELRQVSTPLGNFSFTTDRNPLYAPFTLRIRGGDYQLFTVSN